MLRCTAEVAGRAVGPWDAVNDVFVGRGRFARAIRLGVTIDGVPLARLSADGLLAATPTGSTAYSMSAGGPVIAPHMDAILLTPVIPHPLPVRALVVPATTVVRIRVEADEEATLAIDGQIHRALANGDTIHVEAGPHRVRLLQLRPTAQFYGTLVERLHRW
jgi:NAD+ kinase